MLRFFAVPASLCSLAGRYENPIPPRCLAPIDFLKIPALSDTEVESRNGKLKAAGSTSASFQRVFVMTKNVFVSIGRAVFM
jgi:hypothetical protein